MKSIPMQVPYGAVYFRKSNPPASDWERDYTTASKDGFNIFRHWFMWGSIETAPGVFDWSDYDRQLELAEKNGIKTIAAEISTSVPEWLYYERPDLLMRDADGKAALNHISGSSATGGFCGGLCLDKEEGRELTANFLRAFAKRYKDHPALLGYDIWNECSAPPLLCFCDDTARVYQSWLREKYGDIAAVGRAWHRYSFTAWEQIRPPVNFQPVPECFDWLEFKKENAYKQMKWRIDTLRSEDSDSLICAHGMALSLENMANGASDEWMAAERVQVYGLTFVQSRKGAEDWKQFQAMDLTRSGSRGKPFWHAEAQGGPLWMQPQVEGRKRYDGRITRPSDLRLWNMTSFAGGARGILYPRWRPLLDGPLFGAFGPYGMDGLPTPSSEMASSIAKWANAPEQKELMEAAPVQGEVGIVVVPEAQTMSFLMATSPKNDSYKKIMHGAYRSLFEQGIQADFVHIDDIELYQYLYLPYPMMLSKKSFKAIADWVQAGGRLVSEGCPAYFSDGGHADPVQPGSGMGELFGVKEKSVEFTPDLMEEHSFTYRGSKIFAGEYLQTYQTTTAVSLCGGSRDGSLVVRNKFGDGEAILVGTCPSKGYYDHEGSASLPLLLLEELGMERHVTWDNPAVRIRLHKSDSGSFIWILNPTGETQQLRLRVNGMSPDQKPLRIYWQGGSLDAGEDGLCASVEPQDVIIARLE